MEVFETNADDSFELAGEVAILCLTILSSFSALSTSIKEHLLFHGELKPHHHASFLLSFSLKLFFIKTV